MSRLSIPVFALLLVAAVVLAVRFSPLGEGPDALDEQIVDYVYDTMLPPWGATVVDDCKLPSRAIKGPPAGEDEGRRHRPHWLDVDSGACGLERRGQAVPRGAPGGALIDAIGQSFVVPDGREYEVDPRPDDSPPTTLQ